MRKTPDLRAARPTPPAIQRYAKVTLRFERIIPGNRAKGFVPGYQFRVLNESGSDVGHITFRIGDTPHVVLCAGHIGYEIYPKHRGNGYAFQACQAIAPFVAQVSGTVIITTDPDNIASIRTIEKLGAEFIEEYPVPKGDPHYAAGSRVKRRYRWMPKPDQLQHSA
jgi:tagatose 1,6-diphosphate aldolase